MAGIIATSASVTMVDGDTSPDNSQTGYAAGEQVSLSVTGSPSAVKWTLSIPTGSVFSTLVLSGLTARFTPDVHGEYLAYALVDSSTEYILRMSVTVRGAVTLRQALRLLPSAPVDIPAPAVGRTLFSDSANSGNLSVKLPDNSVIDLES